MEGRVACVFVKQRRDQEEAFGVGAWGYAERLDAEGFVGGDVSARAK